MKYSKHIWSHAPLVFIQKVWEWIRLAQSMSVDLLLAIQSCPHTPATSCAETHGAVQGIAPTCPHIPHSRLCKNPYCEGVSILQTHSIGGEEINKPLQLPVRNLMVQGYGGFWVFLNHLPHPLHHEFSDRKLHRRFQPCEMFDHWSL